MPDPWLLYQGLQGLTLVFVLACLDGVVRAVRAEPDRAIVGLVAVGALAALVARWWAPWGPHDINDRIRLLVSVQPQLHQPEYGWGRPAFWRTLLATRWTGPHDLRVIADATAVTSVFGVVAVGVWARLLGLGRAGVATAVGLVALDPLLIRFSHTDAPQIHELWPWLAGLAGWTAHTRTPCWRHAVLGASGLTLAATMRPESVLLLPVALAIAWAQGQALPWRRADTVVGLGVTALWPALQLFGLWSAAGGEVARRAGWGTLGPVEHGLRHWIVFQPEVVPWGLGLLVVLGVLAAPGRPRHRIGWGVAVLALGLFVPGAMWSPGVGDVPLLLRHQLRVLPVAWLVVAFGVDWAAAQVSGRAAVGLVLLVLGLRGTVAHHLTTAWTIHAEHAAFREAATLVPPGCRLVAFRTRTDTGLVPPLQEIAQGDEDGWRHLEADDDPTAPIDGCVWWWRGGVCSVVVADPEEQGWCDRFEAARQLTPVAETWLPDHPWLYDRHRVDPVRVGLYRVDGMR